MTRRSKLRVTVVVATLLLAPGSAVWAQGPAGNELGFEAMLTTADPTYVGGGITAARRVGGRVRIAVTATGGARGGEAAGRGELVGHFLVSPAQTRGLGVYGLGGIAGDVGPSSNGYLVLGLGLETSPGGVSGWHLETGIGGGLRIAAGWRHRWLHR